MVLHSFGWSRRNPTLQVPGLPWVVGERRGLPFDKLRANRGGGCLSQNSGVNGWRGNCPVDKPVFGATLRPQYPFALSLSRGTRL